MLLTQCDVARGLSEDSGLTQTHTGRHLHSLTPGHVDGLTTGHLPKAGQRGEVEVLGQLLVIGRR